MIPIILGSVVLGHLTYKQILGYPTELRPVGEYRLISFHSVPKTDIYLWVIEKGETIPRAYRIDYSISARKRLYNFRKLLKDGEVIIINFLKNEEHEGKFRVYKFPMPNWLNKEDE